MSKLISLSVHFKDVFQHLILQRLGLVIRPLDRDYFAKKISMRMNAINFVDPQDYYLLLKSRTQESQEEWKNLVTLLTNNESYFFRDKEQIKLLKNHILPKIIHQKQVKKTIRICSAGCSTGEEPYSLAILLQELIPNYKEWNLSIFGIDINQTAINSAKKAIYSPWSFRGVSEGVKRQYFQQVNQQYQLEPRIKKMVQFHLVNLVQEEFPFKDIDLFICRNVFIYFNALTITKVVGKIYHALNPDGYLLTGHAELSGQNLSQFNRLSFSQSLIYQRPKEGKKQTEIHQLLTVEKCQIPQLKLIKPVQTFSKLATVKNTPLPVKKEPIKPNIDELLEIAEILIRQEQSQAALKQFQKILDIDSNHSDATYGIARIYADKGQYQDAISYCNKLLKINPSAISPHYLLAKIAEETGKLEEAKFLLKKIIYLDPNSIAAYLDLIHIYKKEGNEKKANKMYKEYLKIFQMLPSETPIIE